MILFVVLSLALLVAATLLWLRIPPRVARLLPECDAIAYINLSSVRLATHLQQKPVTHTPEYQGFIDATGVVPERDLDSVAFALTRMADPTGPNGPVAFSEVFEGRFDSGRLTKYLASQAPQKEKYAGSVIYTMPVTLPLGPATHLVPTGRTLRIAVLDQKTLVVSNAPTTEQIHAMLDRQRESAWTLGGPSLLTGLYGDVPYFSSVWGIGALALPFADAGRVSAFGLHLPFPDTTAFVASLRYTTALGLRVEQIAGSGAEAGRSVQKLNNLLTIFRQIQQVQSFGPHEASIRQVVDSLQVTQKDDRAVLTARIPLDLLRDLASSPVVSSHLGPSGKHLCASKPERVEGPADRAPVGERQVRLPDLAENTTGEPPRSYAR